MATGPLISVFCPSHDPKWLPDVLRCMQEQSYSHWELVVVANGPRAADVLAALPDDPRIRANMSAERKIGALKRAACEVALAGLADLLLEYDHDDLLTPDCLQAVAAAYEAAPSRDCFIWSDDVTCDFNGQSNVFQEQMGWRHYPWKYKGQEYTVNAMHEVGPRSLCEVLYAPDHVRCWSRSAYRLTGGHNTGMGVGDDHELLIRTYLAGVHFAHVRYPLYIHRQNEQSTNQQRVHEIQATSRMLKDVFLHQLVEEWCRREGLPMLDLGGAHNPPKGYIPVDTNPAVRQHPGAMHCDVFDLAEKLKPGSVGAIRAFDFLEHIPASRVPALMNLLYDLLVPGGWLLTHTPAVCDDEGRAGRGAFQDPTHVSYWSTNNWWYLCRRDQQKYVPELRCRFQAVRTGNWYPSPWHREHLIPYVIADVCALKDENEHWPGVKEI